MKKLTIFLLAFLPATRVFGQAQPAQAELNPVWSNPTFIVLAVTALVLLAVIFSLTGTMRNLAGSSKPKAKNDISGVASLLAILFLSGLSTTASAAEAPGMPPATIGGLDSWIFVLMSLLIVIEFIVILTMIRSIRNMLIGLGYQAEPDESLAKPIVNWKWLDRQLTDAVPLENEAEVMTDHEYDGIRELDNNLPPWWVYGFYFTIIFGFIYLLNYHIFQTSPLQTEEYQNQLAEAALEKKERLKEVAASIDETNVTMLVDPGLLASGKEIYNGNCANCHGQAGEGGVGPNLTDVYWLHGGGINNVFKTIKYGVPAKGMIAWQTQLNPESMQKVASYIMTLQGTNPANAKEPQGPEWVEEVNEESAEETATDSLIAPPTDSSAVAMVQ